MTPLSLNNYMDMINIINIMKFFSLVYLSCLSISVYAQDNVCPDIPSPNYQIHFNVSPVTVDYGYSATQLHAMSSHGDPIGLYAGNKDISIQPHVKALNNPQTGAICAKLSDITVNFNYQPQIHIASESQGLSCTMQRVLNHEKTHYAIEMRAVEQLKTQISDIIRNHFNHPFYAQNKSQLEQMLAQQNQQSMQDINAYFNQQTQPYHHQLDTPENYQHEMTYCSDEENRVLFSRLQAEKQ